MEGKGIQITLTADPSTQSKIRFANTWINTHTPLQIRSLLSLAGKKAPKLSLPPPLMGGGQKMQVGTSKSAMQKNAKKIQKKMQVKTSLCFLMRRCPVFQAKPKKQFINSWQHMRTDFLKKTVSRPSFYRRKDLSIYSSVEITYKLSLLETFSPKKILVVEISSAQKLKPLPRRFDLALV